MPPTADLEAIYRDGQGPLWSSPVLLTVPGSTWINANESNLHRYDRARKVKAWREAAYGVARITSALRGDKIGSSKPVHGDCLFARIHVVAFLVFSNRQRRDPGNWYPTVKACVDGLVDAHLVPDDSTKHVVGPDLRAHPELSRHPVVHLLVYALPGTE